MGKTLENKFVKRARLRRKRVGILANLVLAFGLARCDPYIPPIDETPSVSLSASSKNIKKGENTYLTPIWDDKGEGDLVSYRIGEDKNNNGTLEETEKLVEQNTPILNYSWSSNTSGKFKLMGETVDAGGNTGRGNVEIEVAEPEEPPIEPPAEDYLDVSGSLQNGETNLPENGRVRIHDIVDAPLYLNPLEEITATDGNFELHSTKTKLSDLSGVVVRAVRGTFEDPTSYIETTNLGEAKDYPNVKMAVVPTDDLDLNNDGTVSSEEKTRYKEHVGRENVWSDWERYLVMGENNGSVNKNPWHGLKKWSQDLGLPEDFQGIEICSNDFNEEECNVIKNVLKNSKYPKANLINVIYSNAHKESKGWIYVQRGLAGTSLFDQNANGYIDYATVSLNILSPEIEVHELCYHGLMASAGHSNSSTTPELDGIPSMGRYTTPLPEEDKLTKYNIKTACAIRQPIFIGMKSLDEIYGIDSLN